MRVVWIIDGAVISPNGWCFSQLFRDAAVGLEWSEMDLYSTPNRLVTSVVVLSKIWLYAAPKDTSDWTYLTLVLLRTLEALFGFNDSLFNMLLLVECGPLDQ